MIKHNIDIVRRAWRYSHSQTQYAHAQAIRANSGFAGQAHPGGAGQLTVRQLRNEVLALLG